MRTKTRWLSRGKDYLYEIRLSNVLCRINSIKISWNIELKMTPKRHLTHFYLKNIIFCLSNWRCKPSQSLEACYMMTRTLHNPSESIIPMSRHDASLCPRSRTVICACLPCIPLSRPPARWAMMTSSNGTIFRVIGPLCGEFTGEFPVNSPHKGQWRGALMFTLICAE